MRSVRSSCRWNGKPVCRGRRCSGPCARRWRCEAAPQCERRPASVRCCGAAEAFCRAGGPWTGHAGCGLEGALHLRLFLTLTRTLFMTLKLNLSLTWIRTGDMSELTMGLTET